MGVGHAADRNRQHFFAVQPEIAVDVQPTGVQIDPCLTLTGKMCREKVPFHDPGLL
jgi:hypothetical protein